MSTIEDLSKMFHNVDGQTIQQRKRNFNKFIDEVKSSITADDDLDDLVRSMKPTNRLERKFKTELLAKLKRNGDLLQTLKGGDRDLVKMVLNNREFFKETVQKLAPDVFVNEVLPCTSPKNRLKVIACLSGVLNDENRADDFFRAIDAAYGLEASIVVLPSCSVDLINSTYDDRKIEMNDEQMVKFLKKQNDFLIKNFDDSSLSEVKYPACVRYLATANHEMCWELQKKYGLHVKFGRRSTKKILEKNIDFLKDISRSRCFHESQLMKTVIANDLTEEFFLSFFYETPEEFLNEFYCRSDLCNFVKYLPRNKGYELIIGCFKKKYGEDLENQIYHFGEKFLSVVPVEIRETLLERRINAWDGDENLDYLYGTKKSIPLLKRLLDNKNAADVISLFFKTCELNNDANALVEVLDFLQERKHANLVISEVNRLKNTDRLSGELLRRISSIEPVNLREPIEYFHFVEKYLQNFIDANVPCKRHVVNYLELLKVEQHDVGSSCDLKTRRNFIALIGTAIRGHDSKNLCVKFLTSLIKYNRRNRNQILIGDYRDLLDEIKKNVAKDKTPIVKYCLLHDVQPDEFDALFWKNCNELYDSEILVWYLKHHPGKVANHIGEIINNVFGDKTFLKFVGDFSHLKIPEAILGHALGALRGESYAKARIAVKALSFLATEREYLDAFHLHKNDRIQIAFVGNLVNLKNPVSILPQMLKSCNERYLKYATPVLKNLVVNTTEKMLTQLFDMFDDLQVPIETVSSLYITAFGTQNTYDFFKRYIGDERPHVQKAILVQFLDYLRKNPSTNFLTLLINAVPRLNTNDRELFEIISNLDDFPNILLTLYIPTLYDKISKTPNIESHYTRQILRAIPINEMHQLSEAFITKSLIDAKDDVSFAVKCMFGINKPDVTRTILDRYKNDVKYWSNTNGALRITIHDLVTEFCKMILRDYDKNLSDTFVGFWAGAIEPEQAIEEHLLIQFAVAFNECNSANKMAEFGSKINRCFVDFIRRYDASTINLFCEILYEFLTDFQRTYYEREKLLEFIEGFLGVEESSEVYIATLDIIRYKYTDVQFVPILKRIYECRVPVVKFYFRRLVRSKSVLLSMK